MTLYPDSTTIGKSLAIVKQLNLTDLSHVIPVEDMASLPPNKIVMLATGAQGEEFAALDRISRGTHKYVKLTEHDTIVFSSSAIPGNETSIDKLKDRLYKHDPKVITYTDSDVHASGHGKRGELEWIHKQINYRFFMPVHGSHFMLKMHRDLAESLGAKRENIVIPENGSIIEIRKEGTELVKLPVKAVADPIMVDGFRIGDIQDVVLRDRKMLSEDGMFVVVTIIDPTTMRLRKSPDIVSRGFIYLRDNQDLLYKCRGLIKKTAEDTASATNLDIEAIKNEIGERVSRFLLQKTAKRPIVIPVVLAF
jgi:ribonuclease J